ncbi:hypothetical protein T4A_7421, partial [Trichinella pseudospiralis]
LEKKFFGHFSQNKPIYNSENFENFEKMLFFQKGTKWVLIDSE